MKINSLIQMLVRAILASAFLSLTAVAYAEVQVYKEVEIKAKPEAVWALVGAFNGLDRWHPAVVAVDSEGNGTNVGDLRVLTLGNGAKIIEKLLAYNDQQSLRYGILDSPLPISDYVSDITIADGRSPNSAKVTWSSTFKPKGVSKKEAKKIITGIYQAGFDSLVKLFN